MSDMLKRIEIPIIITAVAALLQVIPYYFNIPIIDSVSATTRDSVLLIVNMAVFVGVISISQVHGRRISRRAERWEYSVVLIAFMIIMMIIIITTTSQPALSVGCSALIIKTSVPCTSSFHW